MSENPTRDAVEREILELLVGMQDKLAEMNRVLDKLLVALMRAE
jgi:hypothetical protein